MVTIYLGNRFIGVLQGASGKRLTYKSLIGESVGYTASGSVEASGNEFDA